MFEFFDHTADLGIRVRAATFEALLADAAAGLTAALVDDVATIRPAVAEEVDIKGQDPELLLFDWLRELLLRFETRGMVYSLFAVTVTPDGLKATISGEPVDPARHPLGHEVKAITYHGLSVERDGSDWVAEVIIDI